VGGHCNGRPPGDGERPRRRSRHASEGGLALAACSPPARLEPATRPPARRFYPIPQIAGRIQALPPAYRTSLRALAAHCRLNPATALDAASRWRDARRADAPAAAPDSSESLALDLLFLDAAAAVLGAPFLGRGRHDATSSSSLPAAPLSAPAASALQAALLGDASANRRPLVLTAAAVALCRLPGYPDLSAPGAWSAPVPAGPSGLLPAVARRLAAVLTAASARDHGALTARIAAALVARVRLSYSTKGGTDTALAHKGRVEGCHRLLGAARGLVPPLTDAEGSAELATLLVELTRGTKSGTPFTVPPPEEKRERLEVWTALCRWLSAMLGAAVGRGLVDPGVLVPVRGLTPGSAAAPVADDAVRSLSSRRGPVLGSASALATASAADARERWLEALAALRDNLRGWLQGNKGGRPGTFPDAIYLLAVCACLMPSDAPDASSAFLDEAGWLLEHLRGALGRGKLSVSGRAAALGAVSLLLRTWAREHAGARGVGAARAEGWLDRLLLPSRQRTDAQVLELLRSGDLVPPNDPEGGAAALAPLRHGLARLVRRAPDYGGRRILRLLLAGEGPGSVDARLLAVAILRDSLVAAGAEAEARVAGDVDVEGGSDHRASRTGLRGGRGSPLPGGLSSAMGSMGVSCLDAPSDGGDGMIDDGPPPAADEARALAHLARSGPDACLLALFPDEDLAQRVAGPFCRLLDLCIDRLAPVRSGIVGSARVDTGLNPVLRALVEAHPYAPLWGRLEGLALLIVHREGGPNDKSASGSGGADSRVRARDMRSAALGALERTCDLGGDARETAVGVVLKRLISRTGAAARNEGGTTGRLEREEDAADLADVLVGLLGRWAHSVADAARVRLSVARGGAEALARRAAGPSAALLADVETAGIALLATLRPSLRRRGVNVLRAARAVSHAANAAVASVGTDDALLAAGVDEASDPAPQLLQTFFIADALDNEGEAIVRAAWWDEGHWSCLQRRHRPVPASGVATFESLLDGGGMGGRSEGNDASGGLSASTNPTPVDQHRWALTLAALARRAVADGSPTVPRLFSYCWSVLRDGTPLEGAPQASGGSWRAHALLLSALLPSAGPERDAAAAGASPSLAAADPAAPPGLPRRARDAVVLLVAVASAEVDRSRLDDWRSARDAAIWALALAPLDLVGPVLAELRPVADGTGDMARWRKPRRAAARLAHANVCRLMVDHLPSTAVGASPALAAHIDLFLAGAVRAAARPADLGLAADDEFQFRFCAASVAARSVTELCRSGVGVPSTYSWLMRDARAALSRVLHGWAAACGATVSGCGDSRCDMRVVIAARANASVARERVRGGETRPFLTEAELSDPLELHAAYAGIAAEAALAALACCPPASRLSSSDVGHSTTEAEVGDDDATLSAWLAWIDARLCTSARPAARSELSPENSGGRFGGRSSSGDHRGGGGGGAPPDAVHLPPARRPHLAHLLWAPSPRDVATAALAGLVAACGPDVLPRIVDRCWSPDVALADGYLAALAVAVTSADSADTVNVGPAVLLSLTLFRVCDAREHVRDDAIHVCYEVNRLFWPGDAETADGGGGGGSAEGDGGADAALGDALSLGHAGLSGAVETRGADPGGQLPEGQQRTQIILSGALAEARPELTEGIVLELLGRLRGDLAGDPVRRAAVLCLIAPWTKNLVLPPRWESAMGLLQALLDCTREQGALFPREVEALWRGVGCRSDNIGPVLEFLLWHGVDASSRDAAAVTAGEPPSPERGATVGGAADAHADAQDWSPSPESSSLEAFLLTAQRVCLFLARADKEAGRACVTVNRLVDEYLCRLVSEPAAAPEDDPKGDADAVSGIDATVWRIPPARPTTSRRALSRIDGDGGARRPLLAAEIAMCLLAELCFELHEETGDHLPKLVHAALTCIDSDHDTVAWHACRLVQHALYSLHEARSGLDDDGGDGDVGAGDEGMRRSYRQANAMIAEIQAAGDRRLLRREPGNLAAASVGARSDAETLLASFTALVVDAVPPRLVLVSRPGGWADVALDWARGGLNRGLALRALHIFKALDLQLSASSLADLVALAASARRACADRPSRWALALACETQSVLLSGAQSSEEGTLLLFPQLLWASLASCLGPSATLLTAGATSLAWLLSRVDVSLPATQHVLMSCVPGDEGGGAGALERVAPALVRGVAARSPVTRAACVDAAAGLLPALLAASGGSRGDDDMFYGSEAQLAALTAALVVWAAAEGCGPRHAGRRRALIDFLERGAKTARGAWSDLAWAALGLVEATAESGGGNGAALSDAAANVGVDAADSDALAEPRARAATALVAARVPWADGGPLPSDDGSSASPVIVEAVVATLSVLCTSECEPVAQAALVAGATYLAALYSAATRRGGGGAAVVASGPPLAPPALLVGLQAASTAAIDRHARAAGALLEAAVACAGRGWAPPAGPRPPLEARRWGGLDWRPDPACGSDALEDVLRTFPGGRERRPRDVASFACLRGR